MPKRTFATLSVGTPASSPILVQARKRLAAKRTAAAMGSVRGRIAPGYTRRSGFYGRFGPTGELKFFDTATSFLIDATGEVPATGQLVLIPQGVTESTRVGRKCTIKSIQARWNLNFVPAAAATAAGAYTIYVILDKQCNGAAAAVTDVFTGTGQTSDFRNLANSSRFQILKVWNRVITSQAGATTAYNNNFHHIEFYKKCNIPIEYSSTTGAIGEIKSNNIFLVAGCTGGIDDLITVTGNVRVRFSDN